MSTVTAEERRPPFRTFTVEDDDELLGTMRVKVEPTPQFQRTWGDAANLQERQRQFVEDAIRAALERFGQP